MSTIPVYNLAGEPTGEIELPADLFGVPVNDALIHQAVVATLANQRQGTADTKTRGEVKHTTRKLYRQKGTGRARQGMRSAPHWKGGGIVFGPHPRDYSQSLPKKMRRAALLSALSAKASDDGIRVAEALVFAAPKTQLAAGFLAKLALTGKKVLLVLNETDGATALSFRNLANVYLVPPEMVGTYDVLNAEYLLFDVASLQRLQALKREPLGIKRWLAKQGQPATEEA